MSLASLIFSYGFLQTQFRKIAYIKMVLFSNSPGYICYEKIRLSFKPLIIFFTRLQKHFN